MKKSFLIIPFVLLAIIVGNLSRNELINDKEIEKIKKQLVNNEVTLAEVYKGEWETVCSSHPYDGPLHLKKYNKTYAPVASGHDNSWGLIFIEKDGKKRNLTGTCKDGFKISLGCALKSEAVFAVDRIEENCIILKQKS